MARFLIKLSAFFFILLVLDRTGAAWLKKGMDRYYGLDKPAEILCVGHSRVVWGIDEALLEERLNRAVAKYAVQGTSLEDHHVMIEQFLDAHPGAAKTLLYVVDDYTFGKGLGSNQYKLFFPFMDTPCVASHVREKAGSWSEYVSRKCLKLLRFSDTTIQSVARWGLMGKREVSPEESVNVAQLQQKLLALRLDEQYRIAPENVDLFEKILALAHARGLEVILFYMPFIDLLEGQNQGGRGQALARFRQYAIERPFIDLIEVDQTYTHRHDLFTDATHPNRAGQIYVTSQLANALLSRLP